MWTKREVIIFVAGVETFLTFSHLGFTVTAGLNAWAIVVNALITAALLWWASRVRRA
jgi:hypothetical protein